MPTENTTTRSKSLPNRRRGQSVIEFAVVSMIFVSMLFLSYNAVMAFAFQQYVAHAVFMSARAYQAGHDSPANQQGFARDALRAYLPGLDSGKVRLGNSSIRADITNVLVPGDFGIPPMGSGTPTDSGAAIRVVFEMPLVALPLGKGDWDSVKKIRLEASSYLGREPTSAECYNYFADMLESLVIPGAPAYHKAAMTGAAVQSAMTDNGC